MAFCECGTVSRMIEHITYCENGNHTITLTSQEELFRLSAFFGRVPYIRLNYYQVLQINTIEGVVCYKYALMKSQ